MGDYLSLKESIYNQHTPTAFLVASYLYMIGQLLDQLPDVRQMEDQGLSLLEPVEEQTSDHPSFELVKQLLQQRQLAIQSEKSV